MIDWSAEYLQENTVSLSGPDPLMSAEDTVILRGPLLAPPGLTGRLRGGESVLVADHGDGEQLWAEQYLTDVPSLAEPLTASQQTGQSPVPSILFVGTVCECSTGIKHLDLDWTEEFSQFTKTGFRPEDENAEIYRQEFWKKLENEWIVSKFYNYFYNLIYLNER